MVASEHGTPFSEWSCLITETKLSNIINEYNIQLIYTMIASEVKVSIMTNAKVLDSTTLYIVKRKLWALHDIKSERAKYISFKDPVVALILSLLFGFLGIDRLYIGNISLGILKLITIGGAGVWVIIDWFLIMRATRKVNSNRILRGL